jgi:hypothetical protein
MTINEILLDNLGVTLGRQTYEQNKIDVNVDLNTIDINGRGEIYVNPNALLSNDIPLADAQLSSDLRAGSKGVAVLASRSDHKHPIKKQDPSGITLPTPVFLGGISFASGAWTITVEALDEESINFLLVADLATDGVVGTQKSLRLPNIAGFYPPQIMRTATLRYLGNPPNYPIAGSGVNSCAGVELVNFTNNGICTFRNDANVGSVVTQQFTYIHVKYSRL